MGRHRVYREGCGNCDYPHEPPHHPPRHPVCFKSGARILTSRGEIPVEDLRVGDRVATFDGGESAVSWIGWRKYNLLAMAHPQHALPVRIRQNALADGVPSRDLYVSQEHAIFIDGVLVPARVLVNGRTIALSRALTEVKNLHYELEAHGVLFAEGAPAESFLESGDNRLFFSESSFAAPLHPKFAGHIGRLVPNRPRGLRQMSGHIAWASNLARRAAAWAGARRIAEFARNLNERALKHHLGAAAIRSSEGPFVEDVRRRLETRADELESATPDNVIRLCA